MTRGSSMIFGMTKAKIAVSVDPARVAAAKRAVSEGRAPSVSAYVERAMASYEQPLELSVLLDDMLAETGGPLTDEPRQRFDRELGLPADLRRLDDAARLIVV